MLSKSQSKFFLIALISFVVIQRLIPHLADFSAMIAFALWIRQSYSFIFSIFIVLLTQFISDLLLTCVSHYPIFGEWSWFMYSGYVLVVLFYQLNLPLFTNLILTPIIYWSWTNFGVWLVSGIYLKTFSGFFACYVLALPFLFYQMLGTMVFYAIFQGIFADSNKRLHFPSLKIYHKNRRSDRGE